MKTILKKVFVFLCASVLLFTTTGLFACSEPGSVDGKSAEEVALELLEKYDGKTFELPKNVVMNGALNGDLGVETDSVSYDFTIEFSNDGKTLKFDDDDLIINVGDFVKYENYKYYFELSPTWDVSSNRAPSLEFTTMCLVRKEDYRKAYPNSPMEEDVNDLYLIREK